jgi:hypothetical protein
MTGAGILSLSLGGKHENPKAQAAGESLLRRGAGPYNSPGEHYHYGMFYCAQAMYQLGGKYFAQFYPRMVVLLLQNQGADGAWQDEPTGHGIGRAYTTALSVLALRAPYEGLPVTQR